MVDINNQLAPRLSLAELATHPEWQVLTVKQMMFLSSYIQSGIDLGTYNAQFAVQQAYNVDEPNGKILKYELLANRKIRRVLDLHFGRTEADVQHTDLVKAIAKALRKDPSAPLSDTLRAAIRLYEHQSGVKILPPKSMKKFAKVKRHA